MANRNPTKANSPTAKQPQIETRTTILNTLPFTILSALSSTYAIGDKRIIER